MVELYGAFVLWYLRNSCMTVERGQLSNYYVKTTQPFLLSFIYVAKRSGRKEATEEMGEGGTEGDNL